MKTQNPLTKSCSTFICKLQQCIPFLKTTSPSHLLPSLLLIPTITNPTPSPLSPSSHDPLQRAELSFHTLQTTWYNTSTGLYDTTGWWNSANILTSIANLGALSPSLSPAIEHILQTSFAQAPTWSISSRHYVKTLHPRSLLVETTWSQSPVPISSEKQEEDEEDGEREGNGFLNDYYDDEGWWALTWIQAYDLTSDQTYLTTAMQIFADMHASPPTPCGGGIWWSKSHTYVNAIANELYLSVAAHLANRVAHQETRREYREIAMKQWTWFLGSGMINEEWTINDGLKIFGDGDCRNNGGTVWSYNQGVVLEGLVELFGCTFDEGYIDVAVRIAHAAIRKLAGDGGILHDPCEERGCGADGVQFKGVFMRGLMSLLHVLRERDGVLEEFVRRNAESIWRLDRNERGEMGVVWDGPVKEVNAGSFGSALDAFIADVAVENEYST